MASERVRVALSWAASLHPQSCDFMYIKDVSIIFFGQEHCTPTPQRTSRRTSPTPLSSPYCTCKTVRARFLSRYSDRSEHFFRHRTIVQFGHALGSLSRRRNVPVSLSHTQTHSLPLSLSPSCTNTQTYAHSLSHRGSAAGAPSSWSGDASVAMIPDANARNSCAG